MRKGNRVVATDMTHGHVVLREKAKQKMTSNAISNS
jgi:hypothetical protein